MFTTRSAPLAALVLAFALCAVPGARAQSSGTGTTPASAPSAVSPHVSAGDAIRISAFPDTAFSAAGIYTVDEQGCAVLPLVGEVCVVNRSLDDLAEELNQKYAEFLRYPSIRIEHLIRVACQGGFVKPGMYHVPPDATLWEVVQLAGGTSHERGLERLKWRRGEDVLSDALLSRIESGATLSEIGFRSGDQITVANRDRRHFSDVLFGQVLPTVSLVLTMAVSVFTLAQFAD